MRITFTADEWLKFQQDKADIRQQLLDMPPGSPRPGRETFLGKCLLALTERDAKIDVLSTTITAARTGGAA